MERKKADYGIGALDIVGIVFLVLGIVFSSVSILIAVNLNKMEFSGNGDPIVLPIIFGAIGAPFLILGILFVSLSVRKRCMANRLLQDGHYVMADVVAITPNYSVQVNGRSPFVVECHYQDPTTGTLCIFRSRNLFYFPEELSGNQIRVYVDPDNMKHYYVDVASVLPRVEVY